MEKQTAKKNPPADGCAITAAVIVAVIVGIWGHKTGNRFIFFITFFTFMIVYTVFSLLRRKLR
jgi:hypothetical protein